MNRTQAQLEALAAARAKRKIAAERRAPEGWRSPEHLLTDTREYIARACVPGHSSPMNSLAIYLRVNPRTVQRWLAGEKMPMQPTLDAIAQWRRVKAAGL